MAYLEKSIDVPYSHAEMFTLVSDVASYAEFVPGCDKSIVDQQLPNGMVATLCFSKAGIKQCFTTQNHYSANNLRIDMSLVKGPFKYLKGLWSFTPHHTDTATIVKLAIEFEFSYKLISMAFCPFFQQITTTMVTSFSNRAEQIYGKRNRIN